jgi:hypothetical protein
MIVKEARQTVFLSLLFFLFLHTTGAQEQLSVSIDNPVYSLIEILVLRGVIPPVSAVKPYSNRDIRKFLKASIDNKKRLSPGELAILETMYEAFQGGADPVTHLQFTGESDFRSDLSEEASIHTVNMGKAALKGVIGPSFAYNVNLGVLLDKIDPGAFAPFDFSKEWDGFHIWADKGKVLVSNGINSYLSISLSTLPELSFDLLDSNKVNLQLSRVRRQWGVGEGSLSLSRTARPMEAFAGSVQPASWWKFHFLTGVLGNWWNASHEQKMFSLHRLELFPFDWLYVSPWESVVWAKRVELSYMNPIMSYYMGQQLIGDLDNIAFGADAAVSITPLMRLYFSFFLDEIVLVPLSEFFTRPNNQFAWQAGLKVPIPWLPFCLLTFQYTKIEPYCYTHYPQSLPQYTDTININFSHDGENIGYHLPPNSDEFLLRFFVYPISGLTVTAQYQLIRHGTGDHTAGQLEGDIDIWLDYSVFSEYRSKDFLHDGIYEWINALKLSFAYTFTSTPATIWGEYSFVHADNYLNVEGSTVVKNLLGLGVKIRYLVGRRNHALQS